MGRVIDALADACLACAAGVKRAVALVFFRALGV
jgi:hypothetical protein